MYILEQLQLCDDGALMQISAEFALYVCECICVCIYIHTHSLTLTHTSTHTHTYICTNMHIQTSGQHQLYDDSAGHGG